MRGLSITLREALLSFTNAEAAQPLDIFWGVVAPAARSTTGQRQRPESLAEPQPACADPELVRRFADAECPPLLGHADSRGSIS
jgi:hypothetical protein